jgi:fatty acid amide hydrolase
MRRAVRVARESLEKAGHQLIPFNPPDVAEALNIYFRILLADQGKFLREAL